MKYSIGVDYGTESGRVLLLNLDTGEEAAVAAVPYPMRVIDRTLPESGEVLPPDWALQNPEDYLHVLYVGVPEVLKKSQVDPQDVIGLGIDFTSCTVMPVDEAGTPLCMKPGYRQRKHAWPKLWKHHSAQRLADEINQVAESRQESFLARYGGKISSEWYFPKLIEVFEEDREVYDACSAFVEATDWVIWQLTGSLKRNSCTAGYKAMWSEAEGLPDKDFFTAISPEFTHPAEKLGHEFYPLGSRAGFVTEEFASKLGLQKGVAVAVGNVDAHVSVPGAGVNAPGTLVMVMGTSICHLTVTEEEVRLPGITGVVRDGVLPGLYGYEAGQAAVGDMFAWFVRESAPASYAAEAERAGVSLYEYLETKASELAPGESGLVALDWWNGNRSILADADLTGVIAGLTLATRPEEIYRALLESTAFGARRIVENFREHGVPMESLVACGGIAQKSPLLMQMYADVCGLPVTVRTSAEIPARGSALFGAVAAGKAAGGFDTIEEASAALAPDVLSVYEPNADSNRVYDEVYAVYRHLYEHLGETQVKWLHQLKRTRLDAVRTRA